MGVAMALVDYIPVGLFLAAAIILQRDLYNKMSKGAFALFSAGTIIVFMAGLYKATWKLLYGLGICDFSALSACFFPMQTTGFFLAAAGLVALLTYGQGKGAVYCSILPLMILAAVESPTPFSGTMLFVVIMVLSVLVLDICLVIISTKVKSKKAIVLFIISFFLIMGMGYLSSKDFAEPMMNWIAEAVNTCGQGALLLGAISLRKNGLAELSTLKKA